MGVEMNEYMRTKVSVMLTVPCTFNGKITEDKISYLQHVVTCKHNLLYKEIYMQK